MPLGSPIVLRLFSVHELYFVIKKNEKKRTMPLGAPLYSFCLPFSKYDESVTERRGERERERECVCACVCEREREREERERERGKYFLCKKKKGKDFLYRCYRQRERRSEKESVCEGGKVSARARDRDRETGSRLV